jgi:hypothetical protein
VAVVLLYAAGLNPCWRFQRDSALYMGLARSLAEHGAYSFNAEEHTFALPGFPAVLSLVYLTAGQSFLAMNALVSVFGLACIVMGYLLYRELGLAPLQLAAATLLLAFSRTLYYYSSQVMTDVPFLCAATAALFLGARALRQEGRARWAWWLAATAAALAACTVRPVGPALLVALVAGLWLQRGARARWKANAGMTAVLLGPVLAAAGLWALRGAAFGAPLGSSYVDIFILSRGPLGVARYALSRAPGLFEGFSDCILGSNVGVTAGVVLALLMAPGLVRALRDGERMLCTYGVICLAATCLVSPGRRHLLAALPAMVYWLVLGAAQLGAHLGRRGFASPRLLRAAGVALLALALLGNLVHLSRTVYEARSPHFYAIAEDGIMRDYLALTEWLRAHAGPDDLVLTGEGNVVRFFSGVRTFQLPNVPAARRLRMQALSIVLNHATYVVVDHGSARAERSLAGLPGAYPQALERVGRFGELELFRVHLDRLRVRGHDRAGAGR